MDSENKQRVSLYLDKQTVKTVDMFIKKHGLHSRNEFFERAAENLIADEAIKTGGDVMSEKDSRKVNADIYIDDRNVGGLPDWGVIYQMIKGTCIPQYNTHYQAPKPQGFFAKLRALF